MPDNGPPPACDSACQAKIILNGGVAARVLDETCHAIYEHIERGGSFPQGMTLVEMANDIEDQVFKFQRAVLEQIGFKGPWPHSLSFKE